MSTRYKVAIVGSGPAGLSAAIALGCEGITADIFTPASSVGGRMASSPLIENIPAFTHGISGKEWNARAIEQVMEFGAGFIYHKVSKIAANDDWLGARLSLMSTPGALDYHAVIVATGITMSHAAEGQGATSPTLRIVVGGGDAAVQVALQHAATGMPTTLVVRGKDLSHCSAYLRERVTHTPNLTVRFNTTVFDGGEGQYFFASGGDLSHTPLGHAVAIQWLVGGSPDAAWTECALDSKGFVLTGSMTPFHTSRYGVFACGDVRSGSIKRVTVAAGEGVACGHTVANFLKGN